MTRSADYPEKILDPGEEILIHQRPHWVSLARPTLLALLVVMLTMLLLGLSDVFLSGVPRDVLQGVILLVLLVLLVLWTILPVLRWLGTSIVATTYRVVFRQGIARKETSSVSLAWLQGVSVEQSLLGRMLHYGTLHISSYELGGLRFDRVPYPHDVESRIRTATAEVQRTGAYPQRFYYAPAEGYPAYPPVGAGYPPPPLATYQPAAAPPYAGGGYPGGYPAGYVQSVPENGSRRKRRRGLFRR